MINGILNINKEKGYTSHDVVAKLRGILKQKKIGHTGTLDPDATGVLPICLGKGTGLVEMLTDYTKEYQATLLLGQTSDTQDATGQILKSSSISYITEEQVITAIHSFLGDYWQIPPMYSALKVGGKKLYELARAGLEVERKPRLVKIDNIKILKIELPRVKFQVECSKGTYIRTLCHDIGEKLGCGGLMEELIRTRVGPFKMDQSLSLDQVRNQMSAGRLSSELIKIDSLFSDFLKVSLIEGREPLAYNGNLFRIKDIEKAILPKDYDQGFGNQALSPENKEDHERIIGYLETHSQVLVYDRYGIFIGIYAYQVTGNFKIKKMFLDREELDAIRK